jgi:hypothetical protein
MSAKANQAIGEYIVAFSKVEDEIGEAVKVVLSLQKNDASDAIVALLDFAKKGSLILAAIPDSKNADGSLASKEWKEGFANAISEALGYNQPDRVRLAHSLLQPNDDGSVDFKRITVDRGELKGKGKTVKWTYADFTDKISKLNKLAESLHSFTADLTTIKIIVPSAKDFGWLATYNPAAHWTQMGMPPAMRNWLISQESPEE